MTSNSTSFEIPKDAEILTVQRQKENACIWVLVNPDDPKESRHFEIYGTGHSIYFDMGIERKYIGTFQTFDGDFVFHVFERIN